MPENENVTAELQPISIELVAVDHTMPEPDSLIAGKGVNCADSVTIEAEGEYKRGMVLMRTSSGDKFVKATKTGLSSAEEAAILCDDVTIGENEYAETLGYFTGEFNAKRVILPWEDEDSNHDDEIDAIKGYLRVQGIFLR